jgi:uncharacterized membrane protein YidH (DUF202 family)
VSVFDPGLQPERTGLAWRRTMISLAVVSLAAVRVLPDAGGTGWLVVPGLVGLVAAIALLVWGEYRYRWVRRRLARDPRAGIAGGPLVPLTAATTLLLGAAAAVYVLAAA